MHCPKVVSVVDATWLRVAMAVANKWNRLDWLMDTGLYLISYRIECSKEKPEPHPKKAKRIFRGKRRDNSIKPKRAKPIRRTPRKKVCVRDVSQDGSM